jgi:uncharacterized membrane protein (GlpM family)
MAFDEGPSPEAWRFVLTIWVYPLFPLLMAISAWIAFACGVFCLIVAGMIVDQTLISLGVKAERIRHDQTYLAAVRFVRVIGILLFAYAMALRYIVGRSLDPNNLRSFFGLYLIGLVLWAGMLTFLIFTRSVLLAAIAAGGLLEWLVIAVVLLFEYKKPQSWEPVRPDDKTENSDN